MNISNFIQFEEVLSNICFCFLLANPAQAGLTSFPLSSHLLPCLLPIYFLLLLGNLGILITLHTREIEFMISGCGARILY